MSTRATVARQTEKPAFVGRYSHWDGYPSGVGTGMIRAIRHFGLDKAKKVLLDEHIGGWSNIAQADWTQEIGYIEDLESPNRTRPQCFCHGDRNEEEWVVDSATDADNVFIEWAYVFDESNDTLMVYEHNVPLWDLIETIDLTDLDKAELQLAELNKTPQLS